MADKAAQTPAPASHDDDDDSLAALIARSPLLPDAALRRHWRRLAPWLPPAARDELSDILLEFEQSCQT